MSRSESEAGTITIPSSEWARFKALFRDRLNKDNEELYKVSLKVHEHLSQIKAKGFDRRIEAYSFLEEHFSGKRYGNPNLARLDQYDIVQSVAPQVYKDGEWITKSAKPKQKDFPKFGNTTTRYSNGVCDLVFDNERRTAFWKVDSSNHAVSTARSSRIGKAFFKALDQVKWTRDSGGEIFGNDEYNIESGVQYGGGGAYVTGSYGPSYDPNYGKKGRSTRYGSGGFRI